MARNKRKNRIANTLAVCFWLCAWQAASVCIGQKLILVSPLEVCGALLALLPTARFWASLLGSMARILGGFFLAAALGTLLAALAARFKRVEEWLAPPVLAMKTVPGASFDNNMLSPIEHANADFLTSYENATWGHSYY